MYSKRVALLKFAWIVCDLWLCFRVAKSLSFLRAVVLKNRFHQCQNYMKLRTVSLVYSIIFMGDFLNSFSCIGRKIFLSALI